LRRAGLYGKVTVEEVFPKWKGSKRGERPWISDHTHSRGAMRGTFQPDAGGSQWFKGGGRGGVGGGSGKGQGESSLRRKAGCQDSFRGTNARGVARRGKGKECPQEGGEGKSRKTGWQFSPASLVKTKRKREKGRRGFERGGERGD